MKTEMVLDGNKIVQKTTVSLQNLRAIISNRIGYRYKDAIRQLKPAELLKIYNDEAALEDFVEVVEDFATLDPDVWYYCEYYSCYVRFNGQVKVSSLAMGTTGYPSAKLEETDLSTSFSSGVFFYVDYNIVNSCTVADSEKLSIAMGKLINIL